MNNTIRVARLIDFVQFAASSYVHHGPVHVVSPAYIYVSSFNSNFNPVDATQLNISFGELDLLLHDPTIVPFLEIPLPRFVARKQRFTPAGTRSSGSGSGGGCGGGGVAGVFIPLGLNTLYAGVKPVHVNPQHLCAVLSVVADYDSGGVELPTDLPVVVDVAARRKIVPRAPKQGEMVRVWKSLSVELLSSLMYLL